MINYFEPFPNMITSYHKDGSGDEYFGKASKGSTTSDPRWMIAKLEYSGVNWITKYPDGEDSPRFIWDNVESLTYQLLGS
jgi:hypothetical protein